MDHHDRENRENEGSDEEVEGPAEAGVNRDERGAERRRLKILYCLGWAENNIREARRVYQRLYPEDLPPPGLAAIHR